MLNHSINAASPEVEASVKQLLIEDSLFDQQDRRTVHREFLVRPVIIECRNSYQRFEGFTRNISMMGMSIVTRNPIHPQTIAKIEIYRINTGPTLFLAECRWAGPFGEDWNVTGWNFLNIDPRRLASGPGN